MSAADGKVRVWKDPKGRGPYGIATAPDGTFVAFRVPDPLPAHRRIRLRLPASTSIKTQWRGVTARGLKVHDENGAELSLGGR